MNHSQEFINLVNDALTRIQTCELSDVKALVDQGERNITLIDVRDKEEYQKGYIPGAIHLSRGMLEVKIVQMIPNKATEMVLYCGGGNRSALAADNLKKMGYTNVISMNDGYKGWLQSGYAVTLPKEEEK